MEFLIFLAVIGGMIFFYRARQEKIEESERSRFLEKYNSALNEVLSVLNYSTVDQVEEHTVDQELIENMPRAKDEKVLWAGYAKMYEYREVTTSYQHHGPRARIKIAKGLYYTAGSSYVDRQTEQVLTEVADGVLCITTKKVMMINKDPVNGKSWTKTWRSIADISGVTGTSLVVSPNTGKSVFFYPEGRLRVPKDDPRFISALIHKFVLEY